MTDTTEAQEQDQEQTQDEDQQETQAEPTPQEIEARKVGWRPEAEWDERSEATWLPAEDFMKRNERLKDRGDKILKAEVTKQTRQIAKLEQTIQDLGVHLTKADQHAHQKALKELSTKADQAVEDGDTDAYRRTKAEIKDLETEVKAEVKPETKPTPPDDPDYNEWLAVNGWYDENDEAFDVEMGAYADSIIKQISRLGLGKKTFYERITTETKKKYPDRFGNQRRRLAPVVEDAGGGGGSNSKPLWSQVPKDARTTFKRFVDQGLYEDTKEGREKYAEIYVNE